jgi:hypothetical protein
MQLFHYLSINLIIEVIESQPYYSLNIIHWGLFSIPFVCIELALKKVNKRKDENWEHYLG